jgi:nitrogen-specific signal transduction histidine kinase
MRQKLKKELAKLIVKVSVILLIISLAVSFIFAIILINTEKDLLVSNADANFKSLVSYSSYEWLLNDNVRYFYINSNRVPHSEIEILDSSGEISATTDNICYLNFADSNNEEVYGYIDFEKLKSLLTEKEYEQIKSALNDEQFKLMFTEYYINSGNEIIPANIEIIPSNLEYSFYDASEVIEEFNLSPKVTKDYTLNKVGKMCQSIIDTDFILGNYQSENLIDSTDFNIGASDDISRCENLGAFTYVYYNGSYIFESDEKQCTVLYAEKFNVIDSCYNQLLMVVGYTLLISISADVAICIIAWKAVKKQILTEQKRREFTNAVAHDIKTPLFVISGNAETLAEFAENEKEKHYVEEIISKANSANTLLKNMLDLSNFENGNYKLNYEQFSLTTLINSIIKSFDTICKIDFDCNDDVNIKADKNLITRAIENLLDNAIKHTNDLSSIKVNLNKNKLTIQNSTTSDIDVNKLLKSHITYSENGNGLGLSIVKSILDIHKLKYNINNQDNIFEFIIELNN